MMNWMRELFQVIQGSGGAQAGNDFRALVDIKVLAHPVTRGKVPVKAAYRVHNAWPTSVAFSDLDAGANALVVQQMTLAHEGFEFKLANNIGPNSQVKF
jgi:phage tail-like protein